MFPQAGKGQHGLGIQLTIFHPQIVLSFHVKCRNSIFLKLFIEAFKRKGVAKVCYCRSFSFWHKRWSWQSRNKKIDITSDMIFGLFENICLTFSLFQSIYSNKIICLLKMYSFQKLFFLFEQGKERILNKEFST